MGNDSPGSKRLSVPFNVSHTAKEEVVLDRFQTVTISKILRSKKSSKNAFKRRTDCDISIYQISAYEVIKHSKGFFFGFCTVRVVFIDINP